MKLFKNCAHILPPFPPILMKTSPVKVLRTVEAINKEGDYTCVFARSTVNVETSTVVNLCGVIAREKSCFFNNKKCEISEKIPKIKLVLYVRRKASTKMGQFEANYGT